MSMDDNDGQMIFRDLGGLKLPDICLAGEENPRKNLTQETCPDRGSNPGPLRDKRACYHLLHSGGLHNHNKPHINNVYHSICAQECYLSHWQISLLYIEQFLRKCILNMKKCNIYKRALDIEFERDRSICLGSAIGDGQTDGHTHTHRHFSKTHI